MRYAKATGCPDAYADLTELKLRIRMKINRVI